MAVNVRSHFLGCKHALPIMTAGGSIVLISSTAARLPTTSWGRWALVTMTAG